MVTAKFQPIDTGLLLSSIERTAHSKGLLTETVTGRDYTQIRFPDLSTNDLGGLTPQLWLRNRNDGATACRLFLGLFRLICSNGLIMGDAYHEKIIHVKGPRVEEFLDSFESAAARAIDVMDSTIDAAADLQERPIYFADDAISIVGNLHILSPVKDRVISSILDGSNKEPVTNIWGLYNLVNEFNRVAAVRGSQRYLQREETLLTDITALYEDIRRAA